MLRDAAIALLLGGGSAICTVVGMPERAPLNVCLTNNATPMALLGTRERFPDDAWARAHQGPYGKSVALGARECLETSRVVSHEAAVTVVTNWRHEGLPEGENLNELTCGLVEDVGSFELVSAGGVLACRAIQEASQ